MRGPPTYIRGVMEKPNRLSGEYDRKGWDIPTKFVVDVDGVCWMNMAHGDPVQLTHCIELIQDMESEGHEELANKVRVAIGQQAEEPLWARTARQHGWTPPKK